MIDHVWTVVCSRSATDRESNNLSLFDVLEQINLLGPLPDPGARVALPLQYEVISLWTRANPDDAEESTSRIRLMSPNGTEAFRRDFAVSLTVPH
jgi:hypothetical protein